MSERSRSSVELEPVTCWPLILGAIGFVSAGILVLAGFAAWSALFPPPKPIASVPEEVQRPTVLHRTPITLPHPPQAWGPERVVKVKREVIFNFTPRYPPEEAVGKQPPPAGLFPGIDKPRRSASASDRPSPRGEKALRASLLQHSRLIDLDSVPGASKALLAAGKKLLEQSQTEGKASPKTGKETRLPRLTRVIRKVIEERDDLRGLPLVADADCLSSLAATKALRKVGQGIREIPNTTQSGRRGARRVFVAGEDEWTEGEVGLLLSGSRPSAKEAALSVAPMEQLIPIHGQRARLALVGYLSAVAGREATAALARRAVFDLSPVVREEAVIALKMHRLEDARPVFLAALRHPWAPATDHAAVALADLNDGEALPALKKLLAEPDPSAPQREGKKWFVREMVRINHLRNCALCHAPSLSSGDLVRGQIPEPGRPLPEEVYYEGDARGLFVRADIVYFRQDFSVMHAVDNPNKWPKMQRFDYLVRKRELTAKEVAALAPDSPTRKTKPDPQREAVRYAIRVLAEKALLGSAR
jgi:hypothetical protein